MLSGSTRIVSLIGVGSRLVEVYLVCLVEFVLNGLLLRWLLHCVGLVVVVLRLLLLLLQLSHRQGGHWLVQELGRCLAVRRVSRHFTRGRHHTL